MKICKIKCLSLIFLYLNFVLLQKNMKMMFGRIFFFGKLLTWLAIEVLTEACNVMDSGKSFLLYYAVLCYEKNALLCYDNLTHSCHLCNIVVVTIMVVYQPNSEDSFQWREKELHYYSLIFASDWHTHTWFSRVFNHNCELAVTRHQSVKKLEEKNLKS